MSVFAEAAELPAAHRSAFLDSACPGEPELRREVEELLTCAEPAAVAFQAASEHIVQPDPDRIGAYDIIEPIGEGGMAVVYRARQNHPVRRTVALKLIKLGMDTRQFVARFEAERQALAVMDHPNVARVYDAGSTDTGRPYFVMEYVAGEPLLDYCDGHNLNLRQRLELFVVVCEAVEHAHRKGIIHRDLKNTNVLVAEVDGRPVPKVIDFGVAKTIDQPLSERAIQTEQGQLIGTPEYMSPEQAERGTLDIDTRSDVYSLGVLLYELIAGVPPIASEVLRSGSYEQVQRVIREAEPPRPSTRLGKLGGADAAGIARRRSTAVPALIRSLRNELEWIPLKAMRKDREQRYRSASELADDTRNYLFGRPLIAGPETASYRSMKFLRRHKAGVAAVLAAVVLLLAGAIATGWQAVRATRAESRAFEERNNANATLAFLTRGIVGGATPEKIPDAKVRQQIIDAMIMPAARDVGEAFRDQPLIEANVRTAIHGVLDELGRSDLALPHARRTWELRRQLLGTDHPETVRALINYSRALSRVMRLAEAIPLCEEALARARRVLGPDDRDAITALTNYAAALHHAGRAADAEPLFREALERRRRAVAEDDPGAIDAMSDYAAVLDTLGRPDQAEVVMREAVRRARQRFGADHPRAIAQDAMYARILWSLNRFDEAGSLSKDVLERRRRVLGEDHPETLTSLSNYAQCLKSQRRFAEAEPLFAEVLARRRRTLGDDDTATVFALNNYAVILLHLKRPAEAEPLLKQGWEQRRRAVGEDHPETITSMNNYAAVLLSLGRAGEAEVLSGQVLRRATTHPSLGPSHPRTRDYASVRAKALDALARHREAADARRKFDLPIAATRPATEPARKSS